MAFFTELFAKPRPERNRRGASDLLNSVSSRDIADIGVRPADFPRIARRMPDRP